MRIKNFQLSFLLIFLYSVDLSAQQLDDWVINRKNDKVGSIVFSVGPEYCFSDTKESAFKQNLMENSEISFGFRQRYPSNFGYKATFNYTTITGSDGTNNRSYSFSSKILQLSVQGEYALSFGGSNNKPTANSIYVFFGVGLLRSSANLDYFPRLAYSYKLASNNQFPISAIFPCGLGYQYDLNNTISIGAEFNLKYTLSDYLDGFKPPFPESVSNDILEGLSFTIGYRLF